MDFAKNIFLLAVNKALRSKPGCPHKQRQLFGLALTCQVKTRIVHFIVITIFKFMLLILFSHKNVVSENLSSTFLLWKLAVKLYMWLGPFPQWNAFVIFYMFINEELYVSHYYRKIHFFLSFFIFNSVELPVVRSYKHTATELVI